MALKSIFESEKFKNRIGIRNEDLGGETEISPPPFILFSMNQSKAIESYRQTLSDLINNIHSTQAEQIEKVSDTL